MYFLKTTIKKTKTNKNNSVKRNKAINEYVASVGLSFNSMLLCCKNIYKQASCKNGCEPLIEWDKQQQHIPAMAFVPVEHVCKTHNTQNIPESRTIVTLIKRHRVSTTAIYSCSGL